MTETQFTQPLSILKKFFQSPLLNGPIAIYALALVLPSYKFQTPDRRIDLEQRGIHSLLSPPIEIAFVVNALYVLLAILCIAKPNASLAKITLAILLLFLVTLTGFGFVLGDPEPGSIVRFGPAAYLWLLAIGMMILSSIRKATG